MTRGAFTVARGTLATIATSATIVSMSCASLSGLSGTGDTKDAGGPASSDGSGDGGASTDGCARECACNADTDTDTNADHCGECNHSCRGGACVGGKCQPRTVVKTAVSIVGLVAVHDRIYWATSSEIHSCAIDACTTDDFVAQGRTGITSFVTDGTAIYWVDSSGARTWSSTTGERLLTSVSQPREITLSSLGPAVLGRDATDWLWARLDLTHNTVSVPERARLTDGEISGLTAVSNDLYWRRLWPSTPDVYALYEGQSQYQRASTELHMTPPRVDPSGRRVLFLAGDQLRACDTSTRCVDGATTLAPAVSQRASDSVVADATNIYWSIAAAGTISRCAFKSCTSPEVVARGQQPGYVTYNETNLFWIEGGGAEATILSLAK